MISIPVKTVLSCDRCLEKSKETIDLEIVNYIDSSFANIERINLPRGLWYFNKIEGISEAELICQRCWRDI